MSALPRRVLALAVLLLAAPSAGCRAGQAARPTAQAPPTLKPYRFLVRPYLQLGDAPSSPADGALEVLWHTEDTNAVWTAEVRVGDAGPWKPCAEPAFQRVATAPAPSHRVWSATLRPGQPGAAFWYRLLLDGEPVFQSRATGRKGRSQPFRVAVAGDVGEGTPGQQAIARRMHLAKPDLVVIPGDIVYQQGSVRQYRTSFWPVYGAEAVGPAGVPLMQSTPFVAAPGNNDFEGADLGALPDGMAYFLYWRQPLNGPLGTLSAAHVPRVTGPDAARRNFMAAAMPRYPQMASFSFDYGDTHWTVLDSNPYADWAKPPLSDWLERDLAAARGAAWRFVVFHHPAFAGSGGTLNVARTQAVAAILERHNVQLVFHGHLHTYVCSRPIRLGDGASLASMRIDTAFDGVKVTRADGPIYVVTGAGGAHLHELQGAEMVFWSMLARQYAPNVYSFTVVDVTGPRVTVRQIGGDGKELDRFVVTR